MKLSDFIDPEIRRFNLARHSEVMDPSFIPIKLTGGIGDVIIDLDAIRFLAQKFQVVIYTDHLEAFEYFYKAPLPKARFLPEYSWWLEFDTFARFRTTNRFHGFLVKENEELFLQQQKRLSEVPKLRTLLEDDLRRYFLISHFAKEQGLTKRSFPLFSLGFDEQPQYHFLERSSPLEIITIHDGIDGSQKISGRATKQWKWQHWNDLVKILKKQYPSHKIIQLGAKTSREIDGVDECLINKTTITEAFDVLAKSKLHIDGDSGLVHAATRMHVPCVVMWGPTPPDFYGYPQNINLTSSVCGRACYGLTPNWNDKCPIGYPGPKCMDEILPEQVMEAINVHGL